MPTNVDVPSVRLVIHWQQSASVEDMLQEFGRAGRDRKSSVSVIFHDGRGGKDSHRLKFMAEKTVESAPLEEQRDVIGTCSADHQDQEQKTAYPSTHDYPRLPSSRRR